MIEDTPIIRDIRKIRKSISEKFGNDPNRYIDHLVSSPKGSAGEPAPTEKKEMGHRRGRGSLGSRASRRSLPDRSPGKHHYPPAKIPPLRFLGLA